MNDDFLAKLRELKVELVSDDTIDKTLRNKAIHTIRTLETVLIAISLDLEVYHIDKS